MHVCELDTPALLIDLDIMERNLLRVAQYAREHGLRLRPHTKTHKTPALGRLQLESGAAGLTVAKVGEAEVMLASGTPDLLVAYPILGERKLRRLTAVARQIRVTVALDSLRAAQGLAEAATGAGVRIGVLAEVDAGLGRVGVRPEELPGLARQLARLPGLEFEGIAFYPGHLKRMDAEADRELARLGGLLQDLVAALARDGLETRIVSGGSTPALYRSHLVAGLTEIRPGTYIFNDRNTVQSLGCRLEDCAASILCTVVSTAVPGQAVIDGGSKTFSSDRLAGGDADSGFGLVIEAPEAVFPRMNEEHGYLDIRQTGRTFRVGETVHVIPNHVCAAVNLHERIHGVRGGEVVETWTVEGRGKLQ